MDVVIRRVAVLTAIGTAAFAAGSVLAWRGVAPAIDLSTWLIVLATIAGFQYFLTAYVLFQNTAGPNNSALFYMMNLYKEAFVYYNMGYASALAWGLFIVGLAITIGLFASARHWVYYAGGDK